MKKFLSLVLALVMTMSLVTISAGAKDFTDADAINYDEAIAVMSAVKVIDGYPDGSFKPATQLNRGQAAKIICNLVLGPTTAAELPTSVAPFKDVTTDNVFAGYIAYCAKEGIVGGYADGTFKPTAPLTGYAFMKMLLGALGYDAEIEGYNDPKTWSIAVAKQALGIGLTAGLKEDFNGVKYVTREEACLYAFNTLKATMVDYDTKTSVNVGDATVTIAGSTAKPVGWDNRNTQTGIKYDGNIDDDGFVQFAEQYFTKLTRKDDSDKFERPANTWVYDKKEIGTYVDYTKLVETYKKAVTGKDVYDLLKAGTIRDDKLVCYVDGAANAGITKEDLVRSNNEDLAGTGTGVLTEIYVDKDKELITIVSINTYLAKASAEYSEKKEYAPLKVFEASATGKNYNVDVESVAAVKDVEKDGFYLVKISKKDVASGEVVAITKPEVLSDSTVTKFSTNGTATKLTTGGQEYKANAKTFYDKDVLEAYDKTLLTNMTYNVYLDTYGNFIGVDIFEGTKNYVFITGFDRPTSNLSVKTADAAAIFLDGTMETIKVNVTDTDKKIAAATGDNAAYFKQWNTLGAGRYNLNEWYTYTVNESGVYTLKPCTRMTASKYYKDTVIKTNNLIVNDSTYSTRVYGEDDTIFLTTELGTVDTSNGAKAITKVTGVYTGVQNVELELSMSNEAKTEGQIYTVYDSDNYIVAAIVIGDAKGSTANYAYVLSKAKSEEKIGDTYYWEFEAIVGGEIKTLTAKSKYTTIFDAITAEMTTGDRLVELRFDGDYVTDIKDVSKIYTNKAAQIDGQNFYDISDANVINLKGRTLYVTATQADYGLALAKDAKAIVIQKENGKKDVKTEFTDVATAIARLADKDPATTNVLEYDGRIVAALDTKGVAQWIVFVSKTELLTGNQTPVLPGAASGKYEPLSWEDSDSDGAKELTIRYYGTPLTDAQVKELIGSTLGSPVKSMNRFLEQVTLENGDTYPINFEQVEVVALKVDGKIVEYADKSNAGTFEYAGAKTATYLLDKKVGTGLIKGTGIKANADRNLYTAYEVSLGSVSNLIATLTDKDKTDVAGKYVATGSEVIFTFAAEKHENKSYSITVGSNVAQTLANLTKAKATATVTVTGTTNVAEIKYQNAAQIAEVVNAYSKDFTDGKKDANNATVEVKGNTATVTVAAGSTLDQVSNTGLVKLAIDLIDAGNDLTVTFPNGKVTLNADNKSNAATVLAGVLALEGNTPAVDAPVTVTVSVANKASGAQVDYTVVLAQAKA